MSAAEWLVVGLFAALLIAVVNAVVNAAPAPDLPPTGAERYLAGRMADPQYAIAYHAAALDLPPHVVDALADGLPPGVRVGLVADGRDIPEGWRRLGHAGVWSTRTFDEWPRWAYEVRPPALAPPETVTVELPVDVVREIADGTADTVTLKNATAVAACRAALPEGDQARDDFDIAYMPKGDQP